MQIDYLCNKSQYSYDNNLCYPANNEECIHNIDDTF